MGIIINILKLVVLILLVSCSSTEDVDPYSGVKIRDAKIYDVTISSGDTVLTPVEMRIKNIPRNVKYNQLIEHYDIRGNSIVLQWYGLNDSLLWYREAVYDDRSLLTTESSFTGNGELIVNYRYKYDEWGNLIERIRSKDKNNSIKKRVLIYNNRRLLTGTYDYIDDELKFSQIYEYNNNGNRSQCLRYRSDGTLIYREQYNYINEFYLKREYFYSPGDTMNFARLQTYDDQARLITDMTIRNGRVSQDRSYSYDDKDRMEQYIQSDVNLKTWTINSTKNKYIYDENGRLIEDQYYMVIFDEDSLQTVTRYSYQNY